MKSTREYWNPLSKSNKKEWAPVEGLDGKAEYLTLSLDQETGEYTRLTRFMPGADTSELGQQSHLYPEEIFIVKGRIFDVAFDMWLKSGYYASRPPGEVHGPFYTDIGCLVLEISFPERR